MHGMILKTILFASNLFMKKNIVLVHKNYINGNTRKALFQSVFLLVNYKKKISIK